jgi:AraC-like DNA-binding protein
MKADVHGHSALLLQLLATVLERLGIDGGGFLREVGIDERSSVDVYVDARCVDAALGRLAAERGDRAFGLTLAAAEARGPLGLYGHLVWLSGTLRDALDRAARFYALATRRATLSVHAEPGAPHARLVRQARDTGGAGGTLAEFAFATFLLRARAATQGRFAVRRMGFAHALPEGSDAAPYSEHFGVPVTFGRGEIDELAFDAPLLDAPLATADPVTLAALEAQATRMNPSAGRHGALLAQVRRAAAEVRTVGGEGRALLPAIARRVGVGERSLRRRLAEEESVTLREVVDAVRRDRARELLDAGRPVKEVAFLLGFSEPSAFSRAYKRWTGAAPRRERGRL